MRHTLLGALARRSLARPRLVLLLGLFIAALAAAGASELRVDISARAFYGTHSGAAAAATERRARWGADDDQLLVVVEGVDLERVADREALEALAARLRGLAGVRAVVSPTSLPAAAGLVSPERELAALFVRLDVGSEDLARLVPVVSRLREVAQSSGLRAELAGIPAVHGAFFAQVLRDQLVLGPAVLLAMGLVLLLVFRRVHAVLLAWGLSGFALLVQLGVMGYVGEPLGLLNQAYFTLTTVIAVSEAVHLLARAHEELRAGGDRREGLARAGARAGVGAGWALVTTGAGFAALALGPPVLRSFGLFALPGLVAVWLGVVVLGPAALELSCRSLPPAPRPSPFAAAVGRLRRWRWLVRGLALVALLAGGAFALQVPVDNHLAHLLPDGHPVRRAGEVVDEALGGSLSLDVELQAPRPGAWFEEEGLAQLREIEGALAAVQGVGAALGPATLARAAPGVGLRVVTTTAAELGLPRVVTSGGTFARLVLRVPDRGGRAFEEVARRVEARARRSAPAGVEVRVQGTARTAYAEINRMAGALRRSLVGALLAVVLAVALATRSLGLAASAIVPNALPMVLATVGVGVLAGTLDPLGAVILALALGVGADDTVHLLLRVQEERAQGRGVDEALTRAVARAGRAVGVTTVAVAGGLALNALAEFPPLALLGVLGAATLILAWAADLFVLPAMVPGRGLGPPPGSARKGARPRSGQTPTPR